MFEHTVSEGVHCKKYFLIRSFSKFSYKKILQQHFLTNILRKILCYKIYKYFNNILHNSDVAQNASKIWKWFSQNCFLLNLPYILKFSWNSIVWFHIIVHIYNSVLCKFPQQACHFAMRMTWRHKVQNKNLQKRAD